MVSEGLKIIENTTLEPLPPYNTNRLKRLAKTLFHALQTYLPLDTGIAHSGLTTLVSLMMSPQLIILDQPLDLIPCIVINSYHSISNRGEGFKQ
jgi:hypothetical protein